ncbi:membrane protein [Roseibium aquae]|uniref:Membrane protein n=1 Tax=Roseibium aquae TaxID=1323746 RepID=A0A916TK73_9HYPH|nr:CDP-alcohol phosphatidyltransferase family protein [Roseibium aquae]GGB51173.1 membrane protein [Roseibium aquae]
MFDARLRPLIDPPLTRMGAALARLGVSANAMTVTGFCLGLGAALAVVFGQFLLAFALVVLNRLADGLDGAIARATRKTDLGGYLDIVLDFVFYGALPFGFALHDPASNALAAAALLFSFYANGSAFLAYAIMAAKRGQTTAAQGTKSLYYLTGIAEGAETIGLFLVMCLWPAGFAWLAWGFAAICFVSAAARIVLAGATLKT